MPALYQVQYQAKLVIGQNLALVPILVADWYESFLKKSTHLQTLARYGSQKKKTPHNRTSLVPISFQIVR